jgi:hypothetical protein
LTCKEEVLRIQIWCMEMEEAASTILSTPFCHRMTHNTAQDAVFNKCHRRKYVARCRLHRKEGSQNAQRDSTSFPELDHLVRMNNQIRIGWFVVRQSR